MIALNESIPEVPDRIARLLETVLDSVGQRLELALLAGVDDPVVGAAVARVTERRINYVADLYRATGLPEDWSRSAAVTAVAAYLGHAQLAAAAPRSLPVDAAWEEHRARVRDLLLPERGR